MGSNVLLQFLACKTFRIQATTERHRLRSYERLVLVREVETAPIDHEKAAQLGISGGLRLLEALIKLQTLWIVLAPENVVEVLRCIDKLADHLQLAGRQLRLPERNHHPLVFREPLCVIRHNVCGLGKFRRAVMSYRAGFLLSGLCND